MLVRREARLQLARHGRRLGEKGNIYAWIAVLGGFLGVLCVMRPDIGNLDYNAFFILLSGLMVAKQMLINRLLGAILTHL